MVVVVVVDVDSGNILAVSMPLLLQSRSPHSNLLLLPMLLLPLVLVVVLVVVVVVVFVVVLLLSERLSPTPLSEREQQEGVDEHCLN